MAFYISRTGQYRFLLKYNPLFLCRLRTGTRELPRKATVKKMLLLRSRPNRYEICKLQNALPRERVITSMVIW